MSKHVGESSGFLFYEEMKALKSLCCLFGEEDSLVFFNISVYIPIYLYIYINVAIYICIQAGKLHEILHL